MADAQPLLRAVDLQPVMGGPWSFVLNPGEILGLSGPSGSGKSLLLRALADLDPHGGNIYLEDHSQAAMDAAQWRSRVGYVAAESSWWTERVVDHGNFSVEYVVQLGLPADALTWTVERLSSGERQRLALLRALTDHVQVLLLDEPCANLDPQHAKIVMALIRDWVAQGKHAVLWVDHDAARRSEMADRQLVIHDGRLRQEETS